MSSKKIVLAGGSGLIGTALQRSLTADGYRVVTLVRRDASGPNEVSWLRDEDGPLGPEVLKDAVAVVGLNGASIGRFPWTQRYREVLRSSRIDPTRQLADALRLLGAEAPLFVSASAVGYYGPHPLGSVDEASPAGRGFLAELCADWEATARSAGEDARVATLRTAPIIHRDGVLKPLIWLTQFGLSGPIGGGDQMWPFISLRDEVGAIRHIIEHRLAGAFNLTAPVPASANGLGRSLAAGLRRPYALPVPEWAVKLVLGKDATESLLTCDVTALPTALLEAGYEFRDPSVREAVKVALRG